MLEQWLHFSYGGFIQTNYWSDPQYPNITPTHETHINFSSYSLESDRLGYGILLDDINIIKIPPTIWTLAVAVNEKSGLFQLSKNHPLAIYIYSLKEGFVLRAPFTFLLILCQLKTIWTDLTIDMLSKFEQGALSAMKIHQQILKMVEPWEEGTFEDYIPPSASLELILYSDWILKLIDLLKSGIRVPVIESFIEELWIKEIINDNGLKLQYRPIITDKNHLYQKSSDWRKSNLIIFDDKTEIAENKYFIRDDYYQKIFFYSKKASPYFPTTSFRAIKSFIDIDFPDSQIRTARDIKPLDNRFGRGELLWPFISKAKIASQYKEDLFELLIFIQDHLKRDAELIERKNLHYLFRDQTTGEILLFLGGSYSDIMQGEEFGLHLYLDFFASHTPKLRLFFYTPKTQISEYRPGMFGSLFFNSMGVFFPDVKDYFEQIAVLRSTIGLTFDFIIENCFLKSNRFIYFLQSAERYDEVIAIWGWDTLDQKYLRGVSEKKKFDKLIRQLKDEAEGIYQHPLDEHADYEKFMKEHPDQYARMVINHMGLENVSEKLLKQAHTPPLPSRTMDDILE